MKKPTPVQACLWFLFVLFALAAYWSFFTVPQNHDDAFITFRMAQNLADGRGPYFNPGERVQACTTPLYLLLLAGGRVVTGLPTHQFELILQFAELSVLLWLLWKFGRALNFSCTGALLLPLLLLAQPRELFLVKGMETLLFTSLILGACLTERQKKPVWTGILMGLVACTRTEGVMIGGAYLAYFAIGRLLYGKSEYKIKNLGLSALCATLTGLPFLIFIATHYETLLPNSVRAKMLQSSRGWQSLRWDWWEYLIGRPPWVSDWGILLLIAAAILGTMIIVSVYRGLLMKRGGNPSRAASEIRSAGLYRLLGLLCAFGLLHGGFFVLTRAPRGYAWYNFPEKVLLIPVFAVGLAGLWHLRQGRRPLVSAWTPGAEEPPLRSSAWRQAAGGTLFLAGAYLLIMRLIVVVSFLMQIHDKSLLMVKAHYPVIGQKLARLAPKEWAYAGAEIGVLGYYSGLKCYDLAGIITPESLKYFTRESLSQILLRYRPEIYVTDCFDELIESTPNYKAAAARQFAADYVMLARYQNPSNETRVYCRRDVQSKIHW